MELAHVAPYSADTSPRRFLANAAARLVVFERNNRGRGSWTEPGIPCWNDLGARFEFFGRAVTFAAAVQRGWLDETLDADGYALSSGEYRDAMTAHARYFEAAEHLSNLQMRIGDIMSTYAKTAPTRPTETDRRLRRALAASLGALAEWARDPALSPSAEGTDPATPAELAHLVDVALSTLRFAEALAREVGADELADALARAAAAVARVANTPRSPRPADVPAPRPPVSRTLAPPGRNIAAQPVCANAPNAIRLSTGCSGALIAA